MKINKSLSKILSIIELILIMTVGNLSITSNAFFGGECITKEGYTASDCGQDKCPGGTMNWQKNKCEEYDRKEYKAGCRIGCIREETEDEKLENKLKLYECEDIINLETNQCIQKCVIYDPNSKICADPYLIYCTKKIDPTKPYCNYTYEKSKPPLLVLFTFKPGANWPYNNDNQKKFVENTSENLCGDNYKNCPNMGKKGLEYTKILELQQGKYIQKETNTKKLNFLEQNYIYVVIISTLSLIGLIGLVAWYKIKKK